MSQPNTCCCSIAKACWSLLLLLQVAAVAAAVGMEGTCLLCRAATKLLCFRLMLWPLL
jgi:hypothetical protein